MLTLEMIKEMDGLYKKIMVGMDNPTTAIAPEGIFHINKEGILEVYGYDEVGNWIILPEAEQKRRVRLFRARFNI